MEEFVGPGSGSSFRPELTDRAPHRTGHVSPYPVEKLERERAALDLTDAAQAATQAAILLESGKTTGSRRLTRLAQRLYASADTHRHQPEQAHHQHQTLTATPGGTRPSPTSTDPGRGTTDVVSADDRGEQPGRSR